MRIFVAGGTGAIGVPLVRTLVARGHQVWATTRTASKATMIQLLGATPVVVDALDASALEAAVRLAAPTHIVHELTALPKTGPRRASDLEPTNRLRDEGTRNLLRAAIAAGAQRIVAGSFALLASPPTVADADAAVDRAVVALRSMESQILGAARQGTIEGLILRYGLFYGPGNPATNELIAMARKLMLPRVRNDRGQLPYIHIDDAVTATVAALERGASGGIYDIVDDHPSSFSEMVTELARAAGAPTPLTVPKLIVRTVAPYMARLFSLQVTLENTKARQELGWSPKYPSFREGLRQTLARAA